MDIRFIEPTSLNEENFAPFGIIVDTPRTVPDLENAFEKTWLNYLSTGQFSGEPLICYIISKKAPVVCESMECLMNSWEAYINLGHSRTVIFVALSKSDGQCDEAGTRAFLLRRGQSVVIKEGIWHYMPIPLDEDNPFLMILAKDNLTVDESGVSLNLLTANEMRLSCSCRIKNL